jgi:signal transduction histidine kinase
MSHRIRGAASRRSASRRSLSPCRPPSRGTGLGLYIVQEVLAAHGGQVTVQSAEGHGTTFTITLLRAASAATVPRADAATLST